MFEVTEVTPQIIVPLPTIDTSIATTLVPCAAYDIGSGATKFMGAMVNTDTLTIDSVFSEGSFPIAYREDLYKSDNNTFSDFIQELGLEALQNAKFKIQQDYAASEFQNYGDIQHFAVATAAFRAADNGAMVADFFHEKLDLPVNIISQEEEAKLAYFSAASQKEGDDTSLPIVWDIGGGSMQMTFKDASDHFHVMGGTVASQTFQSLVSEQVMNLEPTVSPNPMNAEQVDAAIALAKDKLTFDHLPTDIIKNQIDHGAQVIAVGSVHNFVVQPLTHLAGLNDGHYYTKEDLHQAIALLTDKTDEEIMKINNLHDAKFAQNHLTNLILVYAMMENMGIEKVHTAKVSNVQGIMVQNIAMKKPIESPIFAQDTILLAA